MHEQYASIEVQTDKTYNLSSLEEPLVNLGNYLNDFRAQN